ncbi:hypothetical protein [uncultured Desulfobacter sp.]|uniref:hypothetical protein n=1 Tax=uncultured Desulfobacter sp. TaxID=240139 RepID=UPI002AABCCE5|nr:hypothetical protein [uncultured Desulfobacter sp.]
MKKVGWLMLVVVLAGCFYTPVFAGDLPRLMVMGEDEDGDTIPRGSRVHKRVMNAFANALINEGFDVYEERAILEDTARRKRRPVEELVDNAKDAGADVIVLFTIYWNITDKGYATKYTTRVEGRLLDVQAGKRLGNFDVQAPRQGRLPADCNRECVIEKVGEMAATLASDVGQALKDNLAHRVDGADGSGSQGGMAYEYKLIFDKFSSDDMMGFEEYLEMFSGYISHRLDPAGMNTATHHEYVYNSRIASAKLNRNLNKALEKLNMKGQITVSGKTYTVKKVAMPKDRTQKSNEEW